MNSLINKKYLYLIILLILLIKIIYFITFSQIYTDSDQVVLWNTLRDYSNLKFHSLQFYGQSYNFNIEVFLAIPFYLLGLSEQTSLSIASIILSSSPFFLFSALWKNEANPWVKYIPLLVLVALPGEYHMLSGMPRGFTGGIFLSSLGIYLYHRKVNNTRLITATMLCGLGIFINPNSILIIPLIGLNKKVNFKDYKFYLYGLLGFIISGFAFIANYLFYKENPEMIIHPAPQMGLSLNNFPIIISKLDLYFNHISPLFYKIGWIWLVIILGSIFYFIKHKNTESSIVIISIFSIIILSFFSNKVTDATNSIFFSGSRMYLGMPLIIAFILKELPHYKFNKTLLKSILVLVIAHYSFHSFAYSIVQKDALSGSKYTLVGVSKIKDLKEDCLSLQNIKKPRYYFALDARGETLLISYGCECLIKDFSPSYSLLYERRTWLNEAFKNAELKDILLIGEPKFMENIVANFPLKDEIKFTKINQYYWIESELSLKELKERLKILIQKRD